MLGILPTQPKQLNLLAHPPHHTKHPSILLGPQILQRGGHARRLFPKMESLVEQIVPAFGKTPSQKYVTIAFWGQTVVAASEQC